jgi:hypothetical protein
MMSDGDKLSLGEHNDETNTTELFRITSPPTLDDAIYVQANGGNCFRSYTDAGWGVFGSGESEGGAEGGGGITGNTKAGVGLHGYSNDSYAIVGQGGNVGVFATNLQSGHNAYLATLGLAGDFYGDVYIHGGLTVAGGHKSAAVPHPDGTQRQLYCIESPEMWFEDVGKGEVVAGTADVGLDPDFAALVNNDDYYIFLTEYGDSDGLFVSSQSPTGFVVRERRGGASNVSFRYRVLAKRADVSRPRLEEVSVPSPAQVPSMPQRWGPK